MAQANELNFLTTLLPLAGIIFIITLGVIVLNQHFQKNLFRQRLEHEELKNTYQHNLFRASLDAQEIERKRIAANLHDEIGAILSIMRMHLVNLEEQIDGKTLTSLQNLRSLVEAALITMRRISHELIPPQLESFGLFNTLKSTVSQLRETQKINVQFTMDNENQRWQAGIELGLYRICMELLNNTLKHAEADQINIQIAEIEGFLIFTYQDNGKGLPEDFSTKGLGFKNIQARAATLGGTVRLGNGDRDGFHAEVRVPLIAY